VNSNDSSKGKSAAIRARLKFPSQKAFIEGYAPNISKTGIFIKTPKPKAVGVRIKFEFQIADGTPVLRGIGEVSWNRAEASKGKPPGMGIKFLKLDAKSRQIVEKIQAFKGEEAPVEQEAAREAAPVEETPAQEAHTQEAPAEEAPVQEAVEKEEADTTEKVAPKTRTKTPRRRRAAKSVKKKDSADGIDFGAIDSMLAQISSESDGSPKRVSGRRARRAAQKGLSKSVAEAAVQEEGANEVRAEAPLGEPRSDSGITAVNGQEPSFEPSIEIKLDEVRELEPETSVELDLESGLMLKKDSRSGIEAAVEAYTAGDDELPLEIESAAGVDSDDEDTEQIKLSSTEKVVDVQRISVDEDEEKEDHVESALKSDLEEEETEQYDLAFLEKEKDDGEEEEEDVQLIPLDDDDDQEEDQSVKVIPIEDEDSEIVSAIASLDDDGIEETDIEDLLEEEDEEKTHVVRSDTQVGDFMDDMNDGESGLPPAATESLLQNTEVEEALDDIFQMEGGEDAQPAEETDSEVQEEPVSAEMGAETMEAEVTKKVDTKNVDKKKKGFFKKLFG
jgi:uncharacterized protein (TIGR02266 family)